MRCAGRKSGILGEGLFELRGKQIRIFYMFLPGRRVVLLDGEIKERGDIPPKTLKRLRGYRDAVLRWEASARKGRKS